LRVDWFSGLVGRALRRASPKAKIPEVLRPITAADCVRRSFMKQHYQTTRRIEFRDTDAAGMAHFSVFFVFMEQAEHELLRHLGLSVMLADEQGPISFPRVAARCDYQRAVKFEDVLDIDVAIVRLGGKSITYEFNFSHEGRPVASGQTTTVCCRLKHGGAPASMAIPDWVAAKLAAAAIE
jgi:acyl-CoA thioester hydrolase